MESFASNTRKEILKDSNTHIIRMINSPPLNFMAYPNVALTRDVSRSLSSIPPTIIMVHDVHSCYMYKIGEIGDFELRNAYEILCENGVLNDKYRLLLKKGFLVS
jgi:hypothetical protein